MHKGWLASAVVMMVCPVAMAATTVSAWDASVAYVQGSQVSYGGKTYQAKWWTQGETPGAAWGAWEKLTTTLPGGDPEAWDATSVYLAGNEVSYQGKVYRAKWWTQASSPLDAWGAWEYVRDVQIIDNGPISVPAVSASGLATNYLDCYMVPNGCQAGPPTISWSAQRLQANQGKVARWELYVDGKLVQNSTLTTTSVADCAPNVTSNCPVYTQNGSFKLAAGSYQYAFLPAPPPPGATFNLTTGSEIIVKLYGSNPAVSTVSARYRLAAIGNGSSWGGYGSS